MDLLFRIVTPIMLIMALLLGAFGIYMICAMGFDVTHKTKDDVTWEVISVEGDEYIIFSEGNVVREVLRKS